MRTVNMLREAFQGARKLLLQLIRLLLRHFTGFDRTVEFSALDGCKLLNEYFGVPVLFLFGDLLERLALLPFRFQILFGHAEQRSRILE